MNSLSEVMQLMYNNNNKLILHIFSMLHRSYHIIYGYVKQTYICKDDPKPYSCSPVGIGNPYDNIKYNEDV